MIVYTLSHSWYQKTAPEYFLNDKKCSSLSRLKRQKQEMEMYAASCIKMWELPSEDLVVLVKLWVHVLGERMTHFKKVLAENKAQDQSMCGLSSHKDARDATLTQDTAVTTKYFPQQVFFNE